MRILVVDDEIVSREKLGKIMDSFGECEKVDSGRSALTAFQKSIMTGKGFDLVTLDISMPDMDGTEVLQELRNLEKQFLPKEHTKSKILMVTGHSEKDTVISCIQGGCSGYLLKPFNKVNISEKLQELELIY